MRHRPISSGRALPVCHSQHTASMYRLFLFVLAEDKARADKEAAEHAARLALAEQERLAAELKVSMRRHLSIVQTLRLL